jgi:ADP-heptose:LPS heptosyltransferase
MNETHAIISLSDTAEVVLSIRLLALLKFQQRKATWVLITYKEFEDVVDSTKYSDSVIYVDRKILTRTYQSPVFSESFSLNLLSEQLGSLVSRKFDQVVNISNNALSGYLTSFINASKKMGLYYEEDGNLQSSELWTVYTNEIFSQGAGSFNRLDLLRQNLSLAEDSKVLVSVEEGVRKSTTYKINEIREKHLHKEQPKSLVAIDVTGFMQTKIDLAHLVFHLATSANYFPVFLLQRDQKNQKEFIQKLSNTLEQKVTAIEFNAATLASILMNTDVLITSKGFVKQLAHLTETPTIALSCDEPSNTGHSYVAGDLVLTTSKDGQIELESILHALSLLLSGKLLKNTAMPESNFCQVIKDPIGSSLVSLNLEGKVQMQYYIKRIFWAKHFSSLSLDLRNFKILSLYPTDELAEVLNSEYEQLDSLYKSVLSMLKLGTEMHHGPPSVQKFFVHLDVLIQSNEISTLASELRAMARPKFLSINAETLDESAQMMTQKLLDLKNTVQIATQFIHQLRDYYVKKTAKDQDALAIHPEA